MEFSLPTLSCVRFGGFGEGIGAADGTVPSLGLIFGITQNLENHGASSWLPALLKCRDAFARILYFPTHFACIYHSPKGLKVKKISICIGIFTREGLRWRFLNSPREDGGFTSPGFPLLLEPLLSLGAALPAPKSPINGNTWR